MCTFPDAWKLACIVSLNKISAPKSMLDTRPIANISHLAKVCERILVSQLTNYLESNHIIDDHQSGFRMHHSMQAAVIRLTDDIRKAIDNDKLTYLILFDFLKTFNCVKPKILFVKMYQIGISIEVILWFLPYLTGRSQSLLHQDCSTSDAFGCSSFWCSSFG